MKQGNSSLIYTSDFSDLFLRYWFPFLIPTPYWHVKWRKIWQEEKNIIRLRFKILKMTFFEIDYCVRSWKSFIAWLFANTKKWNRTPKSTLSSKILNNISLLFICLLYEPFYVELSAIIQSAAQICLWNHPKFEIKVK